MHVALGNRDVEIAAVCDVMEQRLVFIAIVSCKQPCRASCQHAD